MGDFAQGFIRGFAGTLQKGIETRKEDARNYFNRQLEIAQTTGVQNRQRVQQQVEASTRVAKQLQQVGVPKDIIMSIAASNPENLGAFSQQVADAQAKGIPINEQFFRDFVDVSADYKAPDEDFGTFFSRMYEPIASAAQADPEGFKNDQKGSIWAAMLGLHGRERAMDQLAQTEVVDGMSAADLLKYGDNPVPNTQGGPTVTFDYAMLGQKEREAAGTDLSIAERNSINARIEELASTMSTKAQDNLKLDTSIPENNALLEQEKNRLLYEQLAKEYEGVPGVTTYLTSRLGIEAPTEEAPVDEAGGATEGTTDTSGGGGSQEAPTAPVEPPTAPTGKSTEPLSPEERMAATTGLTMGDLSVDDVQDNGDGTSTITLSDGTTKVYPNDKFREVLEYKLGYRPQ